MTTTTTDPKTNCDYGHDHQTNDRPTMTTTVNLPRVKPITRWLEGTRRGNEVEYDPLYTKIKTNACTTMGHPLMSRLVLVVHNIIQVYTDKYIIY